MDKGEDTKNDQSIPHLMQLKDRENEVVLTRTLNVITKDSIGLEVP